MYPIYTVPGNAALLTEQLGTKQKFWFRKDNGEVFLFKEPRPSTGEDWSEKVASELCELLSLPHAQYDLAVWKDRRGVISPNFAPYPYRLVHGNELLSKLDTNYPVKAFFRVQAHILRKVLALIKALDPKFPIGWDSRVPLKSSVEVFVGYLMFDAWIANQDRHHENWSIVVVPATEEEPDFRLHLAPSYDHASSLGRNESDISRKERLVTRDMGRHITAYVEKAESAFYSPSPNNTKPLTTIEAFCEAGKLYRDAANAWLDQLNKVTPKSMHAILEEVPKTLITETAIDFAFAMLSINKERLLATRGMFQ